MTESIRIAVHDGDGTIRFHIDGPAGLTAAGTLPEGLAALEVGPEVSGLTHLIDLATGQPIPKPTRSAEEVAAEAMAALRLQRNALLAASDWALLPDALPAGATRDAVLTYRQALRDLPATTPDPASPAWPHSPL